MLPKKENIRVVFDKYFNKEINKLPNRNMNLYKRIVDNDKLSKELKAALFDLIYKELAKGRKKRGSGRYNIN